MRHGFQIIASCGIVGTLLAVVSADDRLYESDHLSYQYRQEDSARRDSSAADQYYSRNQTTDSGRNGIEEARSDRLYGNETPEERARRYSRLLEAYRSRNNSAEAEVPSAQPDVKNYYRELFGASTQSQSGAAPVNDRSADPVRKTPEPTGRFAQDDLRSNPVARAETRSEGTAPRGRDTGNVANDERPRRDLIHADYTRKNRFEERSRIQPVRATDESPLPYQDVDEVESPGTQETVDADITNVAPPSNKQVTILPSRDAQNPAAETKRIQTQIAANPAFTRIETMSASPAVTAHWVKRGDINVGQECQCDLVVKNAGKNVATDVAVDAFFPETVRLTAADPEGADNVDRLTWQFESLEPGEERVIHITMIPNERGQLQTTALVRFTGQASGVFTVEEPLLKIAIEGPKEVMVGDPASQLIVVSNAGTGVAANVTIEAAVPPGLEHPRGERLLMEVGTLNPGESRTVRLALAAVGGGQHQLVVQARGEGNLRQQAERVVDVIAPSLTVSMDGPVLRYVGRSAEYVVRVTNDGGAASNNVRVVQKLPDGFRFDRADKGGSYDDTGRSITWFVGHLEPGQSIDLTSELTATHIGPQVHRAGVVSEHGTRSESELTTSVDGTASLVLDIVDLDDPVEVGVETAYEIRVRNDGTAPAHNVGISCEYPPNVELLAAKGPTEYRGENGLMLFRSLDELAPGKAAIYRVHVRGTSPGNHRFRVRLASDSITEPLIYEELTKFYAD